MRSSQHKGRSMRLMAAALLSLLLWAVAGAPAGGARAATYAVTSLFSIAYDDAFTLDNTAYQSDSTPDYRWLFMLYDDQMTIDVQLEKITGYGTLTLSTATEEDKSAYLDDFLDLMSDSNASLWQVLENAGPDGIVFYLYRMDDGEGPYLMAETVVNGYAIDFYAYYHDNAADVDEALAQRLVRVLESFDAWGE